MGDPSPAAEGPVAEFSAMRQEIENSVDRMTRLYLFQLSTAGAVFGFALSGPGRTGLLLIVPISSYLLYSAWLNNYENVMHVGRFIDTDLSHHVPGGLRWESWRKAHPVPARLLGGYHHLLLSFAGVTLLSLAWSAPHVFTNWDSGVAVSVGRLAAWLVGVAAFVVQALLALRRW